jgi:hypothetical protein
VRLLGVEPGSTKKALEAFMLPFERRDTIKYASPRSKPTAANRNEKRAKVNHDVKVNAARVIHSIPPLLYSFLNANKPMTITTITTSQVVKLDEPSAVTGVGAVIGAEG